ncbi:acetate/propionate family kinase [Slackia heliotrinireducens]|uniref:acetate/propionate family kinase n=1 Tax=Slackia heliotrinireducens TaxID=84110 RepID=UPI00331645E3
MLVMVVNAGSSSLKSQLIETETKEVSMKCLAEKVGTDEAYMNVSFAPDFEKKRFEMGGLTVAGCLGKLLEVLGSDPDSPIKSLDEIGAVGNRVVAGGEYFTSSAVIDDEARAKLQLCEELAPLHNPHADACIDMVKELLPNTPQVAVFDTAFHSTMPQKAFMYPLPMHYYNEYHVRRYGAHGTSHQYAAQRGAELVGRPVEDLGIITCHLGNGGSITAVEGGKSIDTTMGFTPLEGLMMGTRSGLIDPAIVTYIMRREGKTPDEMDTVLNKQSGVAAISSVGGDMRDVQAAAEAGNEQAQLAIDMYVYRIQKAIGSYFAILPHTDVIVMTAGIGENSVELREAIFAGLEHLGMKLDKELNADPEARGTDRVISAEDSAVKICVVCADEEMRIASDTAELVSQL